MPDLEVTLSGAPASLARAMNVSKPSGIRFSEVKATRLSQFLDAAKVLACIDEALVCFEQYYLKIHKALCHELNHNLHEFHCIFLGVLSAEDGVAPRLWRSKRHSK